MAMISAFTTVEKTAHNSHKFAFKLSPNNYGYWKAMIQPFLITNGLFGYINGTIPCPRPKTAATTDTPSMDNPSYLHWISNDAHVRMILISTISEASFQHVQGITSRDLWLELERAYAPANSSREYTLKSQLLKIEMKGDETPIAYLTRAQEYATALANIGEPFKDKDLVMLVLSGLREEYNGLKTNLLTRSPPVVFNELHGLLTDHDYMLNRTNRSAPQVFTASTADLTSKPNALQLSQVQTLQHLASQLGYQLQPIVSPTPQPQAFFANRPSSNYRGNRRGNSRGGSRGNYNRNREDTRGTGGNQTRQPQFAWASTQNTVYGHCNRCGIGHIPSQCPNQSGSSASNTNIPSQANYAHYSESRSSGPGSTWNPDTGSNSHVTPDLTNLDNSDAYYGNDSLHDESTRAILLMGPSDGGLYSIRLPQLKSLPRLTFTATKASSTIWHQRLGHPHARVFHSIVSGFSLPVSNKLFPTICSACQQGKSSKLSLNNSNFHSNNILDLVYCDVWGPAPSLSFDGHRFFMLCVDHHTRYMWFYPLANKSDVYLTFKSFVTLAERQFHTKLKNVQTDWGGEFRNLAPFFSSLGINHRRSCPHTSEQNGIVERRHRHVVETGLTLLAQSNTPRRFWSFAFETAVYLINRLPSRTCSNKSPFELIFKRSPDYSFLRVFGCQCFPYLRPYNHHKMDFRSTPCVFLGYSPIHHGYRCLDLDTERVYIARHVRFNEHFFPFTPTSTPPTQPYPYFSSFPSPTLPIPTTSSSPDSHTSPSQPHSPTSPAHFEPTQTAQTTSPPEPAQTTHSASQSEPSQSAQTETAQTAPSTRPRPANLRQNPKPPNRYTPSSYHTSTGPSPCLEPTSFTVANKSPEWRQAMAEEFDALVKNGTWSLVPYVKNTNVIDSKWVYRLKTDQNGKVIRHKARLVAKGFNQRPGVDFQETFSPVIKASTIRVVLSLAVTNQWSLRQLDIQNAFLHGDLQETVYLRQPAGFVDKSRPDHVCLLHKSLYGLKQAPRAWFQRLSAALCQLGFSGSKTDPSLFIMKSRGTLVYVLVYVDDIIVTGNNNKAVNDVISRLSTSFAVKDLGDLHYFLGIEIIPHGRNIILSQRKYISELITKTGLSECKSVSSPMSTSQILALGDSPALSDPTKYRQTVGALQYVCLSRPDITFAVNKVCQFMHAPTENHWSAVKRILRYLNGTSHFGLFIRHNSGSSLQAFTDVNWQTNLKAFSDADWAGCPDDRRSTGGFAIYLGSNLISWNARKQRTVSRSSTESEYKALADTVAELTWLEALLTELGILTNSTPTLWCDNLGATYLSANPVFKARTKHVEVDFHFVREKVAQGKLKVQFINTNDQIADIFTKPLPSQRFLLLRSKLQVVPRPQLAGEY
ncbi:putative RNA-directed DNA polymerase [Helianthus debilis subsp. tardiflorus]